MLQTCTMKPWVPEIQLKHATMDTVVSSFKLCQKINTFQKWTKFWSKCMHIYNVGEIPSIALWSQCAWHAIRWCQCASKVHSFCIFEYSSGQKVIFLKWSTCTGKISTCIQIWEVIFPGLRRMHGPTFNMSKFGRRLFFEEMHTSSFQGVPRKKKWKGKRV